MPTYEFECDDCGISDQFYSMQDVPDQADCLVCGAASLRRMTSPYLSRAGGSAYGLIDRAATSAHNPTVVTSLPAGDSRKGKTRYTSNPLHQKLPRS